MVDPIKRNMSTWDGLNLMNSHAIGRFWSDVETHWIFKAKVTSQFNKNLVQTPEHTDRILTSQKSRKKENNKLRLHGVLKRNQINNILKEMRTMWLIIYLDYNCNLFFELNERIGDKWRIDQTIATKLYKKNHFYCCGNKTKE